MPEVLAVIPARGGSKAIPRKNLVEVGGRSLVAIAASAASDADSVTRIIGSTDDDEIADAFDHAGVEVIARPAALSRDDTPDAPVFLHVLEALASDGYTPEIVVNVRPTAPLRTGGDIDAAVDLLMSHPTAQSVKSVSVVGEHPYKMWRLDGEGLLDPILPEWHAEFAGDPDVARQRLPAVYRSNGAVDAVYVQALQSSGSFHPGAVVAYVMPAWRAVDVDTLEDVLIAERRLGKEAPE